MKTPTFELRNTSAGVHDTRIDDCVIDDGVTCTIHVYKISSNFCEPVLEKYIAIFLQRVKNASDLPLGLPHEFVTKFTS